MAEIIRDSEGNILSDLLLMTMIDDVMITGSNGTEMWFYYRKQYEFDSFVTKIVDCDACDAMYKNKLARHFRKTIDGENFDIPDMLAVQDDKPRQKWEQSWRAHAEWVTDWPKDVIKAYKDLTGIDLTYQNLMSVDGRQLYEEFLRIRKEINGKKYGSVEPKDDPKSFLS